MNKIYDKKGQKIISLGSTGHNNSSLDSMENINLLIVDRLGPDSRSMQVEVTTHIIFREYFTLH